MSANVSVQRIDALLPQTQCGKCGHPGCQPYAEGIAAGEPINKCPPGGQETVIALAQLLRVPVLPLAETPMPPRLAFIREDECIGCTKCIQACPVDAIVGAAKLMHTVIADECTGCELCVAPCPVDCIDILPLSGAEAEHQRQRAPHFRSRHQAHQARLARDSAQRQTRRGVQGCQPPVSSVVTDAPSPASNSPASPAVGSDQLKRAKITLVNCRAALKKAEREGLSGEPLAALRQALENAQAALHHAEDSSGKTPPDLLRTYPSGVDEQLRALKTELAYARADLTRLQRRKDVGASQLEAARQRLADAEQRLHDHHG